MRTFKMELHLDFKTIVPDPFVASLREQAQAEDASDFLKKMHAEYEDDESFILAVLKNGVRRHVRESLAKLHAESGLGCTLAPARLAVIDRSPPKVEPVLASEVK